MSTEVETISINELHIKVVRKDIKNMHLSVYPPEGRVRLSAPQQIDHDVLRLYAISKLSWIKKRVREFKEQPRETRRTYVSGESHYYQGNRLLLEVIETTSTEQVEYTGGKKLKMFIRPDTEKDKREDLLKEWYRDQLKEQVPGLIEKWEKVIGVNCKDWGVRVMRTKWGSCNTSKKRINLNLELVKKPRICLEYIIVHELVHLLERHHNDRFIGYMDKFMPNWRQYREELNNLPVAHVEWGY